MNLSTNNPAEPGTSSDNRSENLRQRRAQKSVQRVNGAVNRATGQEEMRPARPVTVRNATFGAVLNRRVATTNPRRQYYVALNSPGAELRLPALPRLRPGPRLVSGLIALACLLGIFSMLFSSFFILKTPVVKGLERLTQADIEASLDVSNYNVLEVNASELRDKLLTQYDILESAKVSVALPNRLTIQVKERSPLIAWQVNDETRWVDAQGFLFTPVGDAPQMLTISSENQPPLYVSPEQIQAVQDAQAALAVAKPSGDSSKEYQDAYQALQLAQSPQGPRQMDPILLGAAQKVVPLLPEGTTLVYSNDNGLGWQDPGGWQVYIGSDLTNFDQKYTLYQSTIEQLNGQGITPAIISVEYLDAPYYRLER